MIKMSTGYEQHGRINQKARTREALIEAARKFIAAGTTPSVDAAAEAASVSRATAYRYFPNQRALLIAAHPEVAATSFLPSDAPPDVESRLDLVVDGFTRMIARTEAQQRTMLRLSLEPEPNDEDRLPLRQGRAIRWIEEALEPLGSDLTEATLHRLVLAIRSAIGIEALVWLTDIAGMSRQDALELMRWSARAMLHEAQAAHHPPPDI